MSDLYERAVTLVEFINSDFGQSGRDVQIEAIKCEFESIAKESKQQRDQLLAALRGLMEHTPIPSSICKERPAYEAAEAAIAAASGENKIDLEESTEYKHLALIWNNFKQLVNAQDMPKQGVTFEMVQAARRILKLERHGESK